MLNSYPKDNFVASASARATAGKQKVLTDGVRSCAPRVAARFAARRFISYEVVNRKPFPNPCRQSACYLLVGEIFANVFRTQHVAV